MLNFLFAFSDGMFKGIYNGRQCHVADIPAVLSRAWTAGVDRIIVLYLSLSVSLSATHYMQIDLYMIYYSDFAI
jgi:TatD DNase family protein